MEGDRSDQPSIESDSLRMQTFSVYPPELNNINILFIFIFRGGGRERKRLILLTLFSPHLYSLLLALVGKFIFTIKDTVHIFCPTNEDEQKTNAYRYADEISEPRVEIKRLLRNAYERHANHSHENSRYECNPIAFLLQREINAYCP